MPFIQLCADDDNPDVYLNTSKISTFSADKEDPNKTRIFLDFAFGDKPAQITFNGSPQEIFEAIIEAEAPAYIINNSGDYCEIYTSKKDKK